ncbi:MAG: flagellar hook capping FlgD N-terminal domain-containing protein, partial [Anaerotignum sp.]|nr:flagellar hook capping FlgD N-terminal domain-containing protein [Anaerotignum sp.]
MSSINDYMTNIPNKTTSTSSSSVLKTETTGKSTLDIDDFYQLMAAQLQNQDMTNPTDSSEFMNQLTMMTTVQAIEDITNVSLISYAASLVGKDVTIGQTDSDGKISELYGTVTATGMYSGEQVVFVEGKSYKLSAIMAVGKLPDTTTDTTT